MSSLKSPQTLVHPEPNEQQIEDQRVSKIRSYVIAQDRAWMCYSDGESGKGIRSEGRIESYLKVISIQTSEVSRHGANLFGFDLFFALGFSIVDNAGATVLTVTTPWQQHWPSLFAGLGCLTVFNHQPLINPRVSPVIQPQCWLPLALRDDVTAELQKLLEAGIIERIDTSPWISNLVVAKKKSGGLRPCVDLRQLQHMTTAFSEYLMCSLVTTSQ
ncbi:hypothetical protein JOB18_041623 [Solea senegalensis]|uniref:Uncharacterized protein n=1 Tax=Solea senegalensis TaxID=28829 RepID=A0AAV6RLJ3_SOLSE|nr:hypothetical protein JOB18_041623 [Solea senegalensis]